MLAELRDLFVRDLERLTAQLEAYPSEESVWVVPDGVLNSGGTLVLHLVGNLSQFVGLELGGVPFVRDRAAEFARRDVSRAELLALLAGVREAVSGTLERLPESRLGEVSGTQLPGFPAGMTVGFFLVHLYGHLNWHLGQLDYHRRMTGTGQ